MNKFESDVKRFDNSNNKKERPKNVLTDSPQTMSRKKIKKMFTLRREKNVNTEEIKKTCKRQLELRRLYQSGELTSKIFPLSIDKKDKSVRSIILFYTENFIKIYLEKDKSEMYYSC